MNQYEGMLIINTALDNASLRKTIADVQDIITREGGQIVSVEEWGRRKLAYEVKKHSDGFYLLVNFDLAGEKVARVRSLFLLNESILRFLIVRRVPRPAVNDRPQEEAGAHAAVSY